MTSAITLAGWFLIFGAYGAFAFGLAVLIGRCIAYGQRDFDSDHPHRERVGIPPSSVASFTAEREARIARAKFRHSTRHGNAA